jgi:ParB family transcriptional regulator, chromosome partitioning protein
MSNTVVQDTKVHETKRTDLLMVDPRNLEIEAGFNVRKDYGDIRGLALNIVQHGVQEPLIGFKHRGTDRFIVTDGHRREKALKMAIELNAKGDPQFADLSKIKYVPVRTASADPIERLYTMAITGEMKKNLTDMERAEMYSRLIDMLIEKKALKRGDAIKEVMANVNVSQATMYNVLALKKLPAEIQEKISDGSISGATVVAITREIKDETEQVKAVNKAIEHAQITSAATGTKKKATAQNVSGMKSKTTMQRLKEVQEQLENNGVKNVRTKLLAELVDALENKRSTKKILELFA